MKVLIVILIIVILLYFFIKKNAPVIPKSHWHHSFDEFQFSAKDFYSQIETAIKKRDLPKVSFKRTTSPQTNVFSTRREYLTITSGDQVFDICAAPYGNGFFVSWWLGVKEEGVMSKIPLLNKLPGSRRNRTYYQIDIETMFRSAIHNIVLAVIDSITASNGIRPLSELERQPKDK